MHLMMSPYAGCDRCCRDQTRWILVDARSPQSVASAEMCHAVTVVDEPWGCSVVTVEHVGLKSVRDCDGGARHHYPGMCLLQGKCMGNRC
jgi:hypothetical protein